MYLPFCFHSSLDEVPLVSLYSKISNFVYFLKEISGCGKLLFETIKGVDGQFHSCAEVFLPLYFELLYDTETRDIVFEILEQIVANVAFKIKPQHSELFWKTLLAALDNLFLKCEDKSEIIDSVLKLVGEAIEYKQGKFLHNPAFFAQQLSKFDIQNLPQKAQITYTNIVILLLLSINIKLPQEQASLITRKILNTNNKNILLHFVENVDSYTGFDASVLPTFLKQCLTNDLEEDSLFVLTKLLLKKSPRCADGMSLDKWVKYPIDFGSKENNLKMRSKFESLLLLDENIFENSIDIDKYLCCFLCLPHLTFPLLDMKINKIVLSIVSHLQNKSDTKQAKKLLFLLNVALESAVHLSNQDGLDEIKEAVFEFVLNIVSDSSSCLIGLKTLDLLLTAIKTDEKIVTMETLLKLNQVLEKNFNSPFHEVSKMLIISDIFELIFVADSLKPQKSTRSYHFVWQLKAKDVTLSDSLKVKWHLWMGFCGWQFKVTEINS